MTVYVDKERNRLGRMIMCHMFADTIAELHEMASLIGMKREWFQPLSFPHYDVSLARRLDAITRGAEEVDRRQGYQIRKRLRASEAFKVEWMSETEYLRNHKIEGGNIGPCN